MQGDSLKVKDFSTWDGTPFFEGYPEEERHVYIVKSRERRSFTAYGAMDDQQQAIFVVEGTLAQLDDFVAEVEKEGSRVTYGLPPFDTNTVGDKAETASRPGLTAETKTGGPRQTVPTEDAKATDTKKPDSKRNRGGRT